MAGTSSRKDFIPLIVPEIRGNEWEYVKNCLDSTWVSSVGAYVDRFEKMLASRVGAKFGVATVNGTAALHTALLVAGVQAGDEVLVSTLTFIAPVNAIRYIGAHPVFIDAEAEYWQMDPAKVRAFLEGECEQRDRGVHNRRTGRRVAAIIPVHILGHPVDIDPIAVVARKFGVTVIEDATEGLGASYHGRSLGNLADIGCFSFNGNKIITTGGGGMLITDNLEWAQKARYLSTQAKDDPIEYIHSEVGYNYRLTNLQAAIGCAQLEQLDSFVAAKRAIAKIYWEELHAVPGISLPQEAPWASSSWWMYTILVDEPGFGSDSRQLLHSLALKGIQTRPLWQPIHLSVAHSGHSTGALPIAERLYSRALSLPCSVGLSREQQARVVDEIRTGAAKANPRLQPCTL
jgi:perosamine synthetase